MSVCAPGFRLCLLPYVPASVWGSENERKEDADNDARSCVNTHCPNAGWIWGRGPRLICCWWPQTQHQLWRSTTLWAQRSCRWGHSGASGSFDSLAHRSTRARHNWGRRHKHRGWLFHPVQPTQHATEGAAIILTQILWLIEPTARRSKLHFKFEKRRHEFPLTFAVLLPPP